MDYAALRQAVAEHAAIRRRQRLQPAGGQGDKIFPPTYPGEGRNAPPRHVFERRRINGEDVWCVLVDSVQSQANRLEEALLAAAREEGGIVLPRIAVDFTQPSNKFSDLQDLGQISSLDAPHRVFDAILRDSLLGAEPFMKSPVGKSLRTARRDSADVIFELSPSALLFGAWNSTGEGGGLGAKFPRCLVSEVFAANTPVETRDTGGRLRLKEDELELSWQSQGVDRRGGEVVTAGRRTGSRIDPLGILNFKAKGKDAEVKLWKGSEGWDLEKAGAGNKAEEVKTSEINHGNVKPSVDALGVTCDYAEQIAVITLAGLRRLGFSDEGRAAAARTALAALGLMALLEQDAHGYALRSRCDLVCEGGSAPLELVHANGTVETVQLTRAEARTLYAEAMQAAAATGLKVAAEPLILTPQDKLVAIVRESRRLALEGAGGEEGEAGQGAG